MLCFCEALVGWTYFAVLGSQLPKLALHISEPCLFCAPQFWEGHPSSHPRLCLGYCQLAHFLKSATIICSCYDDISGCVRPDLADGSLQEKAGIYLLLQNQMLSFNMQSFSLQTKGLRYIDVLFIHMIALLIKILIYNNSPFRDIFIHCF